MHITRPSIDEEAKIALVERFDATLKDNGAEAIESKDQGKRRLAHEMNGSREGIYHIVNAISPSTAGAINEFDRPAKINDDIIRYMIVKVEA